MNNMYEIVFFLVFITSMSPTFCDEGNQEIIMVVDDQTTMHDINLGTWMTKTNPVQNEIFLSEEGKELKISRKSSPGRNCINEGQSCGLLDYCCDPFYCNGYFTGTCQSTYCRRAGQPCQDFTSTSCCSGLCLGAFCS